MKKYYIYSILLLFISLNTIAQRSKDGAKVVAGTEVVNAYTSLTVNAAIGDTSITVTNSNLNTNFSANLATGDLIMIIQVQGTTVDDANQALVTWGQILNYNNCGNYEVVQVESVPNANTIIFDCALKNAYTATGNVVIVRMPRYSSLTINSGGIISADPWNGTVGGIVAIEVEGITTINAGGSIDISGLGFRGGQADNLTNWGVQGYASPNADQGAEKGESIGGDQAFYDTFLSGRFSRGAAANAGGGGNAHNGGGGGGSNAGNLGNWNDGAGVPDGAYTTAWNLEPTPIGGLNNSNSSGGGRGGYAIFFNDLDPFAVGPSNVAWGADSRNQVGGLGGRPLDYSTGKIFMGGAGGAGDGNDNEAGEGGNGGGIIYLTTYDDISGAGQILNNGTDGGDVIGVNVFLQLNGKDAGGGAGAGGTILLQTTGTVSLSGNIDANGGIGGDQQLVAGTFASINEAEGPGGGGGGGYIAVSNGTPNRFTNGGGNGVTNYPFSPNAFPPNGATRGGLGLPNENINSFDIVVSDEIICDNTSASLTASLSGNPPSGTSIDWYDAEFDGNLLFSGANFNTPLLTVTTTYWVRACPAPYLVPVTVTVNPCVTITANFSATDSTLCAGDCIDFADLSSGTPTGWTWSFPGAATLTDNAQNPSGICYNNAGSFDVELIVTDGVSFDTLLIPNFIVVTALPTVVAGNDTSICIGDQVNLSATGATSYNWDNGLGAGQNQTPSPIINTNYHVTGTDANGCSSIDSTFVTINALPTVIASNDTSICLGSQVNLSATGATSYNWDNGLGAGQNQTPSPAITTTYHVTGTDINSCTNTDSVIVTINSLPTVTANATSIALCTGDSVTLTGSGATSYTWDNGVTDGVIFAPATTLTYTVTGTDANGCQNTDAILITVNNCTVPIASFIPSTNSICVGDSITFTDNSTGTSISAWNWTFPNGNPATANTQGPHTVIFNTAGTQNINLSITDANGTDDTTIVITVNALPIVIASNDTSICLGSQVNLSATGATSYNWDNGLGVGQNQTPSPIVNTTYHVTGTDANSCSNIDSVIVTINPLPTVTANATSIALCTGDSVTLTGSGATSYVWDNGVTDGVIFAPATTLTYTVTGTDANGCQNTDAILVTINNCAVPIASFTTSANTICVGDSITFTDNSTGTSISAWNWTFPNGNPATANTQGPHTVIFNTAGTQNINLSITDANGTDDTTIVITVNALPIVAANTTNSSVCSGSPITLTGSGAVSYNWDNGVTDGVAFNPTNTQTYTVTGIDANGCSNTDNVVITVTICSAPIANLSAANTNVCINNCVDFTDISTGGTPTNWTWTFFGANTSTSSNQNPSNICYDTTGTFDVQLIVSNTFGTDTLLIANYITVDSCITNPAEIIIPNVFSPNGDGQNDIFNFSGWGISNLSMKIFNRWGQLLFETDQINQGWNGRTNSGNEAIDGTYFYIISADLDGVNQVYKGTLTLIR
jgi:gliding motility-associated-like protein